MLLDGAWIRKKKGIVRTISIRIAVINPNHSKCYETISCYPCNYHGYFSGLLEFHHAGVDHFCSSEIISDDVEPRSRLANMPADEIP
jgi:hypothetical protein